MRSIRDPFSASIFSAVHYSGALTSSPSVTDMPMLLVEGAVLCGGQIAHVCSRVPASRSRFPDTISAAVLMLALSFGGWLVREVLTRVSVSPLSP